MDTGWQAQPRVELKIRHPGEKFVARHEHEWPLARTQWTRYFLDPEEFSLCREKNNFSKQVEYEANGEGVLFQATLKEETEITGPVAAKLWLSSDTEDADVFVVLRVFAPGGE